MEPTRVLVSPRYQVDVLFTLGAQSFVALLALLLLDGGQMARVVGVAMLAYWISVAGIMLRRPQTPTNIDLATVRWGFWPILVAAVAFQMLGSGG